CDRLVRPTCARRSVGAVRAAPRPLPPRLPTAPPPRSSSVVSSSGAGRRSVSRRRAIRLGAERHQTCFKRHVRRQGARGLLLGSPLLAPSGPIHLMSSIRVQSAL